LFAGQNVSPWFCNSFCNFSPAGIQAMTLSAAASTARLFVGQKRAYAPMMV
jgi:hypothetical protein